jgi:hypothetical protein
MVQHLLGRRGAARISLIPPEVLEALNQGLIATVNLNELLAIDLVRLTSNVARQIGMAMPTSAVSRANSRVPAACGARRSKS